MKNVFLKSTLLATVLFLALLNACKTDDLLPDAPTIVFATSELVIDLNTASQPPIVAVINSASPLNSVTAYVLFQDGSEEMIDRPVFTFYNPLNYSLYLRPLYSQNMKSLKVVAVAQNGKTTTEEFPFRITAMYPQPEIYFSDGINSFDDINYIEDDPMPSVLTTFKSEEDLKWAIFYQVKGSSTTRINDTIYFAPGTKETSVNFVTAGDGYTFEKGTTAIKAKVAAGEKFKTRELLLGVNYRNLITIHLDQDVSEFNGLTVNGSKTLSGKVDAAKPLQSITYEFISRTGSIIKSATSIPFDANGNFSLNITNISEDLGKINLGAKLDNGGSDEVILDTHVGYKLYRVLASLSGVTSENHLTTPGCFFSAETGKVYNYCDAKDNCKVVDVGFAIWDSNKNIRLNSIPNDYPGFSNEKFRLDGGLRCSPNSYTNNGVTTPRDWETVNMRFIGSCTNINQANFMTSTISKIRAETLPTVPSTAHGLVKNFATASPGTINVCIYQTPIPYNSGNNKRVIIMYEKTELVNSVNILSSCWYLVKVEL